jgi:hypothetical protein
LKFRNLKKKFLLDSVVVLKLAANLCCYLLKFLTVSLQIFSGTFNIVKVYINRYLRLLPVVVCMMLYFMTSYSPRGIAYIDDYQPNCAKNWKLALIFAQNYLEDKKFVSFQLNFTFLTDIFKFEVHRTHLVRELKRSKFLNKVIVYSKVSFCWLPTVLANTNFCLCSVETSTHGNGSSCCVYNLTANLCCS